MSPRSYQSWGVYKKRSAGSNCKILIQCESVGTPLGLVYYVESLAMYLLHFWQKVLHIYVFFNAKFYFPSPTLKETDKE